MKKQILSVLVLSLITLTATADVIYCPQPGQITQEKMVNSYWLYEATIDGRSWAQLGGYAPTKGADVTTFSNTMLFPYSTGYPGTMQCNYTATDGSSITLWLRIPVKPDFNTPGNGWKDAPLHNAVYPCHSTMISGCPAITA